MYKPLAEKYVLYVNFAGMPCHTLTWMDPR